MTFAILVTIATEAEPMRATITGTLEDAIAYAQGVTREGFWCQRDATNWDVWPADVIVKVRVEQEAE